MLDMQGNELEFLHKHKENISKVQRKFYFALRAKLSISPNSIQIEVLRILYSLTAFYLVRFKIGLWISTSRINVWMYQRDTRNLFTGIRISRFAASGAHFQNIKNGTKKQHRMVSSNFAISQNSNFHRYAFWQANVCKLTDCIAAYLLMIWQL